MSYNTETRLWGSSLVYTPNTGHRYRLKLIWRAHGGQHGTANFLLHHRHALMVINFIRQNLRLVFVLQFAFSIIHGSGRTWKQGKAWEHLSCNVTRGGCRGCLTKNSSTIYLRASFLPVSSEYRHPPKDTPRMPIFMQNRHRNAYIYMNIGIWVSIFTVNMGILLWK